MNVLKKIAAGLAAVSCTVLPAGCATQAGGAAGSVSSAAQQMPMLQTPAQIAAQVCPILNAALTELSSPLVALPAGAKADVLVAQPVVAAVCALGATMDAASLADLQTTAMPAIVQAAGQAFGLSQQARDNIATAQLLFDVVQRAAQPAPAAAPLEALSQ